MKAVEGGIYQIRNILTNDVYIGSAINFHGRKLRHWSKLRRNIHHSIILQRAWTKYGEENFVFEIIEKCVIKKELLKEREQHYLDTLNPKYNILKYALSVLGFKHSEETKRQMSIKRGGNGIRKVKLTKYNRKKNSPLNEKTKKLISKKLKGIKKSENHKAKIKKKANKPILQLKINGDLIKEWESVSIMLDTLKYKRNHFYESIKIGNKYDNYIWKYK